jgi:FKBP-type peptidyl-prolyl cis-trans isomerase FklB
VDLARKFRHEQTPIDADEFARGFREGLSGEKLSLPEMELRDCLTSMQVDLRQRQAQIRNLKPAQINQRRAERFLAANLERPGVKTLPSGVQYEILKPGTGTTPAGPEKAMEYHYRTTLLDGTEVVSSSPGKPAVARKASDAELAAWREALPLMKPGEHWRLFIPPQHAYGPTGVPGRVPSNELVISDLEVVSVR